MTIEQKPVESVINDLELHMFKIALVQWFRPCIKNCKPDKAKWLRKQTLAQITEKRILQLFEWWQEESVEDSITEGDPLTLDSFMRSVFLETVFGALECASESSSGCGSSRAMV